LALSKEVFSLDVGTVLAVNIETSVNREFKLKKPAIDMYQSLCEVTGKDSLSRTLVSEWHEVH
jgi:hypothetical protein